MIITYDLIDSLRPSFYDLKKRINIGLDYSDTIPNFIREYRQTIKDKGVIQQILCRKEFMTDKELKEYAIWCVREVQNLMSDKRSIIAIDIAEGYLHSKVTQEELFNTFNNAKAAARQANLGTAYRAARCAVLVVECCYDRAYIWGIIDHLTWCAAKISIDGWDAQIDRLLEIFIKKEAKC